MVRATALGAHGDLAIWISWGVLIPAGHVATVICTECDAPHFVDVENFGGRPGWYCADVGLFRPEARSIEAFEIRCDALAKQLSVALGLAASAKSWPAGAPLLWTLGEFEFDKMTIVVYLVPNVGELTLFSELGRFLRTPRGNPHATAIVTNDHRDLTSLILPDGVRIVHLADFVGVDNNGRLTADRDALTRRILPDRLMRAPRRGRPPTKRDEVRKIIEGLDRELKVEGLSERALYRLTHVQLPCLCR
jgi:hypothetical protein